MLTILHVIISILLSVCILVQHRASGLTATFGGSGAPVIQRRGAEKVLYRLTIWLSVAFLGLSVLRWYVS